MADEGRGRATRTLLGMLILVGLAAAGARGEARHSVLADFESGAVTLESYPDEDFDPDDWALQSQNTYGGSDWALHLWGNTWKELAIEAYPLTPASVFEAALYVEDLGELQAIAFGDTTDNVLFYCVAGSQLVLSDRWNVVYQGAFPRHEWHAYRLAIGRDWYDTWGYLPQLTRIIFVNDHDEISRGETIFDEIYDVTDELPTAPSVRIVAHPGAARELPATPDQPAGPQRYRLEVQFEALVYDPDSDTHAYAWDFGDSTGSAEPNPTHTFTATAGHTFTVAVEVVDETARIGCDTCQVAVDPGSGADEFTINFTGDIFMGRRYEEPGGLIDTYGVEYLWEPTLGILGDAADVTMVNAENAFTDQGTPHPTKSVVFRTSPENVAGLVYAGVEIASLGNNHIIDYGLEGLVQTHAVLDSAGIVHGGSGINEYFATQPCYYARDGVRLSFLNFCNRTGREYNMQPFLDAGYEKCGFGYWLEPNIVRAVAQADTLSDLVIAFPHSGEEYETAPPERAGGAAPLAIENCPPYVTPEQAPDFHFRIWPGQTDRQLRRLAIDCGADAVLNAHPHVLQGFEVYQGKLIAHSLGNFMFDLYYPETMPTVVLTARVGKEGIREWTFRPAFIDEYVPRPATGRLGREILDRMADYSRALGAQVGVDVETLTGTIFLDPQAIHSKEHLASAVAELTTAGAHAQTLPIAVAGEGNLSAITSVEGIAPGDAEVRVGREVLWFGRFEQSEGYHMWNLNSGDEWLDETVFVEGEHALGLHREAHSGDNIITMLDRHLPAADTLAYSLVGWMKTENAREAVFSLRFYSQRYSWNQIETCHVADPVDGTTDWTWYAGDCEAPGGTEYFNVRCNLDVPAEGDAYAWFDDLRVVEWESWQPLAVPLAVPYPNNYRFLQVRTTTGGSTVTVHYVETALTESGFSTAPTGRPGAPVGVRWDAPHPNPCRGQTALRYYLGRPAQIDLSIYDVAGRLVATLARDTRQSAGWHTVDWRPAGQAAGIYFGCLSVDGNRSARKLVVVR